ncbi:dipeptidase PepV [Massilistercora timonensis]|uniref:dipeptidase PepV n=1 Tax=Massilistercora timonensis TaxID=2086584 RepID=UPI00320A5589
MERKIDELVKSYREDMIQSLEELVSIPSVINLENAREGAPFGMEIRSALDGLLKLAGELGFETRDYDGYAAAVDFGTEGKEVGILSHIDVVPPGNGWSKNPFVPEIVNGKMYGRGTIDDKGPLVASLYAMKAVKESGLPIRNHVRHIIGCDEETGHRCIKYYLTKEKGPDLGFSPDGMFSVIHAEKGILRFQIQTNRKLPDTKELCVIRIAGGTVVNAVPNIAEVWLGGPGEQLEEVQKEFQVKAAEGSAKMEGDVLHLTFPGVSAHAMQPWLGENAILSMIRFLKEVPFGDQKTRKYFQDLDTLFGDGWEGRNLGVACQDQLSGKLSMNLGILNVEGEKTELKVDVRCPVHIDLDTVWKTICLTCEKYGFRPEYWQKRPPLYVPKDARLVQILLDVYEDVTGKREEAITIGGGTYCRDVENFVSFGPVFPGEPELAHEADEFIDLDQLMECARLYAQALYRLLQME